MCGRVTVCVVRTQPSRQAVKKAGVWKPSLHNRCRQRQDELQRELERIRRENEKLQEEKAEQQRQIQELERKLKLYQRNSTNSSKPPSSDGLAGAPRPRGCKHKTNQKRRTPGGQPGHPGYHRQLVSVEQVQAVEVLLPQQCQHCGESLIQAQIMGEPRRHQVTEIPQVQAQITEYQCPPVVCQSCRKSTYATLPAHLRGQFGPQLTALVAYWTVACRMPRRVVETMLADVLGISLSLGSTQKAWEEVSAAVQPVYEELQQQLPQEAVLNVDETGWRTSGDKRWLWGLVARQFIFYVVALHRNAEVLVSLLGQVFAGIVGSDRFSVYLSYHRGRSQLCWAHLKRDLLALMEARSPRARRFARDALAILARVFRLWHRFRGDLRDRRGHPQPLDRAELILRSIPLQKQLFDLAKAHLNHADKDVCNLATALFVHSDRLFTFLEEPDVDPTNNAAERALRTAVQWRKISFGNRSGQGEWATARLLTVTQTCRRQGRHVFSYLTQAVICHRPQLPAPSLLPNRISTI